MMKRRLWQQLIALSLLMGVWVSCSAPATPVPATTVSRGEQAAAETLPADLTVAAVHDLYGSDGAVIVDVREESEYAEGHIPGAILIPLGELPDRLSEVPTDQPVVVACRSGNRSGRAAKLLREQGFTNIHNMLEGMNGWSSAGYEVEP